MLFKDIFVTLCMLTRRTEKVAGILGVCFFLPKLFRLRFANMGGLDPDVFTRQLDSIKTFKEVEWCGYWNAIAAEYEQMEMPGTYGYTKPMSGESEQIYNSVIAYFAAHPKVDADKIAMIGVSFGGYWSAD